jgi:pimeloyl-ACP methyl ester carboxylesterase
VALIGHSEGGLTAPRLAIEQPRIAALVLMAATGRPLVEVMLDQNRLALSDAGLAGEALEEALKSVRSLLERLAGEGEVAPEELPADQRGLLANRSWLRDHARQDPPATLSRVTCPVLILQGGKDIQVSPEKDARALEQALDAAAHDDHELHLFPQLDHLFKPVRGETSSLAEYFTDRAVDTDFLDLVSHWLVERLEPRLPSDDHAK